MENVERKEHWENIHTTKVLEEVSWFQETPMTSLYFLKTLNVPKTAKIIDIGGGGSLLVDHLLDEGYQDITVLDISEAAIDKSKQRLADRAKKVQWIVADAANYIPTRKYDFWHDRAAFHFLTGENEISSYLDAAQKSVNPSGFLVIGTFSEQGPTKCSGIEINQYSEASLTERLKPFFEKVRCKTVNHETPSGDMQNFVFCSFIRAETD